jgi:hypothetical protein
MFTSNALSSNTNGKFWVRWLAGLCCGCSESREAIGLQMHSCVLQQHLSKSFGIRWAVV